MQLNNPQEQAAPGMETAIPAVLLLLWIGQHAITIRLILLLLICCRYLERCFDFTKDHRIRVKQMQH
jgi:hypothetical protein